MYECRECYEDTDISAGKIKQFCKTCNTQVSCFFRKDQGLGSVGLSVTPMSAVPTGCLVGRNERPG